MLRTGRHFHVWRTRRAVWAVVIGAMALLGTVAIGALQLDLDPRSREWMTFICTQPSVEGAVRRNAFITQIGLCQRHDGFLGEDFSQATFLRAPDLSALRARGVSVSPSDINQLPLRGTWEWTSAIGAPFRAFHGTVVGRYPFAYTTSQSGVLSIGSQADIPYRPLPGLAWSWMFWAAVAYVGLTGVAFVRVHRRLRKGKCPACAYVMAGLARCPECGTVVREDEDEGLEGGPTGALICGGDVAGTERPAG